MDQYIRSLALLFATKHLCFILVCNPLFVCWSYLVLPFLDSLVTEVLPLLTSFCILFFLDHVF